MKTAERGASEYEGGKKRENKASERRKGQRQKMSCRGSDQLEMRENERADTKIEVVHEVMNKERETKDEWEEPVDSGQEIDVLRSDTERGRTER